MSEEEKKNAAPAPAAEAESGAAAAPIPQSLGKGPGKKALLKPLIVFAVPRRGYARAEPEVRDAHR